MLSMTDQ